MLIQSSSTASPLDEFKVHLKTGRYAAAVQRHDLRLAQRFVEYLERTSIAVEAAYTRELDDFLGRELRSWRRRNGHDPRNVVGWRRRYRTAVAAFLRFVHGRWPVPAPPVTAIELFHRDLVQEYDTWLQELRGLAPVTRATRAKYALEFLADLGLRADRETLRDLSIRDIDVYMQQRCEGFRRTTIEGYVVCLRSFLRYLHSSGQTASDLSNAVLGPRIYDNEQIPSALRPEEVQAVLEATRHDHSPIGRRDYAFLMLLAVYGLRASEIVALRLNDFDWKKDILHVRHSKTGADSELPLLREPGEAVLSYLEKGRPESEHRELFLQFQAPYGAYSRGAVLNCVIRKRLKVAGITPRSKKGPHAFRHARAVSLLRAGVPPKIIGDVLGHRSAKSTGVYLKLATEDLRAVGLNIPKEVLA